MRPSSLWSCGRALQVPQISIACLSWAIACGQSWAVGQCAAKVEVRFRRFRLQFHHFAKCGQRFARMFEPLQHHPIRGERGNIVGIQLDCARQCRGGLA